MIRALRLLLLRFQERLLAIEVQTANELLESHEHRAAVLLAERRANVRIYTERLRKVRARIALTAPPVALNEAIKNWRVQ